MRANDLLNNQIVTIVDEYATTMKYGESITIDVTTQAEIENGEAIIGYQYLHGTNADVGGFHVTGIVSKRSNGLVDYSLTCTWNDMIDPNLKYVSDQKKARFAQLIANPKDYYLSITWNLSGIRSVGKLKSNQSGNHAGPIMMVK